MNVVIINWEQMQMRWKPNSHVFPSMCSSEIQKTILKTLDVNAVITTIIEGEKSEDQDDASHISQV